MQHCTVACGQTFAIVIWQCSLAIVDHLHAHMNLQQISDNTLDADNPPDILAESV
jgi:hypothetical protein